MAANSTVVNEAGSRHAGVHGLCRASKRKTSSSDTAEVANILTFTPPDHAGMNLDPP